MDSFFDKHGRDRIIMDWIAKTSPETVSAYRYCLSHYGRSDYKTFNQLMLMAFEAGINFSQATKREPRKD